MSYTINCLFKNSPFDDVDVRVRKALAEHGFSVLTEIEVKATMKKKLDIDMSACRILDACNPKIVHQANGIEPRAGAMLPCNFILREIADGVEVRAVDPMASMQTIENAELTAVAGEVRDMLAEVVKNV